MTRRSAVVSDAFILVGAVVMVAGSFMPLVTVSLPGGTITANAWSNGRAGIVTMPVLLAVLMAVQIGLARFARRWRMPPGVLGLTWTQVHLVLAVQTAVMMVAIALRRPGLDRGSGMFVMLGAAALLLVGAMVRGRGGTGLYRAL